MQSISLKRRSSVGPSDDPFTDEEDLAIWRLALEFEPDAADPNPAHYAGVFISDRLNQRGGFKKSTYFRFRFQLLPNVQFSDLLDPEEKLALIEKFSVKISDNKYDNNITDKKKDVKFQYTLEPPKKRRSARRTQKIETESETADSSPVISDNDDNENVDYFKGNQFSEEEQTAMWEFLFENYQLYEPVSLWSEFKKTSGARSARTFAKRFSDHMAPRLHLAKCDVRTKLAIYRKFEIPVDQEYLEGLHHHAELEIDESRRVILNFVMKDSLGTVKQEPIDSFPVFASRPNNHPNLLVELRGVISDVIKESNDQLVEVITSAVTNSNTALTTSLQGAEERIRGKMGDISDKMDYITTRSDKEVPSLKEYLVNLRNFTASLNLAEMDEIQKRIETAIQKQTDSEAVLPVNSIRAMLDVGLQMIGH